MVQVIGAEAMNERQPVFVNILVTSPSEDTYSIYTLRLTYDNIFAPRYSVIQTAICILLFGFALFVGGFFAARFLYKRKMRLETEVTFVETVEAVNTVDTEVTNDVEDESVPMG